MTKLKNYVFDAGVLALYFAGDSRVKPYFDEVFRGRARGFICTLNLAEFYYKTLQKLGEEAAEIRYEAVRNSRLNRVPADDRLAREAGRLKARFGKLISLADAFLLALAHQLNATLLTTDSTLKEVHPGKTLVFEP